MKLMEYALAGSHIRGISSSMTNRMRITHNNAAAVARQHRTERRVVIIAPSSRQTPWRPSSPIFGRLTMNGMGRREKRLERGAVLLRCAVC